uniref:Uncharacterized protein n=1 Tax=Arundo donax TaxID=35708 RepID=A0A0A9GG42_ARUDO
MTLDSIIFALNSTSLITSVFEFGGIAALYEILALFAASASPRADTPPRP